MTEKTTEKHSYKLLILFLLIGALGGSGVDYVKGLFKEPVQSTGTSYTNSYFYKPRIGPSDESRKFNIGGDVSGSINSSNKKNTSRVNHSVKKRTPVRRNTDEPFANSVFDYMEEKLTEHTLEINGILTASLKREGRGVGGIIHSLSRECPSGSLPLSRGIYSDTAFSELVLYIKEHETYLPSWLSYTSDTTVVITDSIPDNFFLKSVYPSKLDKGVNHDSSINPEDVHIRVTSGEIGDTYDSPSNVVSRGAMAGSNETTIPALKSSTDSTETEPRHIRTVLCILY